METEQIIALIQTLGIASPLVYLLWSLLQKTDQERREMTAQFLKTLEEMIKQSGESSKALLIAMDALTKEAHMKQDMEREDHKLMLNILTEIKKDIPHV